MTRRHLLLADSVLDIEREMRRASLWSSDEDAPSSEALASTEPFCIDTLEFPQWLQFVLLARLRALIEANAALPERSDIAPMAEEYFGRSPENANLIAAIQKLDGVIAGPEH